MVDEKEFNYDLVEKEFMRFLSKDIVPYIKKAEFRPHRQKKFSIKLSYRSDKTSGSCESPKMENKDARNLYDKVLKKLGWF